MENFLVTPLLISLPILIAIDDGRLKLALNIFIITNVPTFVAFFLNAWKISWVIFALRIVAFSFSWYLAKRTR